jgi:predicted RNase H-like HicB family nuclease
VDVTFRVVLEHDPETGDYSAICSELPGCATAGETEAEARANIREAIELYLMPGDINLSEDAKLFDRIGSAPPTIFPKHRPATSR